MPQTVKEYQQRWLEAMKPDCIVAPWDEQLTATSCVIHESARITPMGEWCSYFADFGDTICFYRYLRIPEELDTIPSPLGADVADWLPGIAQMPPSWSRYRSRFSTVEIRRRRYEGERALDKLLRCFVQEGFQPDMRERLIEIVNATLIDFELREVYVLPDDLAAVLARFGNPLAAYSVSGTEKPKEMATLMFDLNARGHREALAEYLAGGGR